MEAETEIWIKCPICDAKTREKVRGDTVLENFPLFCPKCKRRFLIGMKNLKLTVIKAPVA